MSCLAVSENAVAVSSVKYDKCVVYSLDSGNVKNLTEHLGDAYGGLPIVTVELQKSCAVFSSDGKLFAFNTNKCKFLSVWNTSDWSLVENKTIAKNATVMVFTPVSNVCIVADKKGDVYSFEKELPVRVLGHSSMILDIGFTKDEKYIVTSDSDEKVRVSHYPDGRSIKYYLMGHTAFVSGVCVSNNFVLSGSADCTLKLWNLSDGNFLHELELDSPVQSVLKFKDLVAVQLYDSNKVLIIKSEEKNSKWCMEIIKTIEFENNVLNLAVYSNQCWIMTGNSIHNYKIDLNNEVIKNNDVVEKLDVIMKSFVFLEKTDFNFDLVNFLYNKMVEKKKRLENSMNDFSPILPNAKRVKND